MKVTWLIIIISDAHIKKTSIIDNKWPQHLLIFINVHICEKLQMR
jgi:hypothetical protein